MLEEGKGRSVGNESIRKPKNKKAQTLKYKE